MSTPRETRIIRFRSALRWLVRLRRSPRAIAGGFALGVFVALTPTMGIQIAIVLFLATVLNLNRPAALVSIWITNVATFVPMYTFNYWVGSFFWDGPSARTVYRILQGEAVKLMQLGTFDLREQFLSLLDLGADILVPLLIGSLVVGTVAGGLVYLSTLAILHWLMARRMQKRRLS